MYFFRHKGLSAVKIGFSGSPDHTKRLRSFETYSPHGVDVIAVIIIKNPSAMELVFHNRFSTKRLNGEWFDLTQNEIDEAILFIEKLGHECYTERHSILPIDAFESEKFELNEFIRFSLLNNVFFNRKKTADKFGVSRRTIYNLINKYK